MKLIDWMRAKRACSEASQWVGDRTPAQAWAECARGDWMLWALGRTDIDRREIVRLACDAALVVLPLNDDPRVAAAIDAAEGWCAGTVTVEECRTAARGARNADAAAYAYAAAANAAEAAAEAAAAAYAYAAAADAYAAAYAADARQHARAEFLKDVADMVRARVSAARFEGLM